MATPEPSGICAAETSNYLQTHKWEDMGEIGCPYCGVKYDEWWDVGSDYWRQRDKWKADKESL